MAHNENGNPNDHLVVSLVSREEWLAARKALLATEEDFTRLRDELSRQRRALPWVKVDKQYNFDGPSSQAHRSSMRLAASVFHVGTT